MAVSACVVSAARAQAPADAEIVLATTTSVRDAGLLQEIIPDFEEQAGYQVKVIAVGSGQAMALGRQGEADILLVHDPEGELAFVHDGFGVDRAPLMHNEFVIIGPADDPAAVRGLSSIAAFRALAGTGHRFVSRADRSGTYSKETQLWALAGVMPSRPWYRESGQGMSATLQIANELGAYALTDIATLLSHKYPLELDILVEGDSALFNPYHLLLPNDVRFPWLNAEGARTLWTYLLSEPIQREIGAYGMGRFGRSLFRPAGQVGTSN
jgi:tungstate transport system substrate-binding protein